jgi:hypothetical protein
VFLRGLRLDARDELFKLTIAFGVLIFALGFMPSAETQHQASTPQWHILSTEAYPKKRDDIVFTDRLTGFYGTGKLYRTQDGGQSWHLIWSKPGTFIRSLGFIDTKHGFLGNLLPTF